MVNADIAFELKKSRKGDASCRKGIEFTITANNEKRTVIKMITI